MTTATDSVGSITYTYDSLDRLTGKTDPGNLSQAYSLDNVGNRLTLQDPDGGVQTMVYDLLNRLISVMEDDGMIATWSYDPLNRCTTLLQTNPGLTITWGFDPRSSALTVFQSDAFGSIDQSFTYVYDAVANRAGVSDILGNVTTYVYDAKNRLTAANVTGPNASAFTYAYDGNDNILSN